MKFDETTATAILWLVIGLVVGGVLGMQLEENRTIELTTKLVSATQNIFEDCCVIKNSTMMNTTTVCVDVKYKMR
jgi:hypothetical protein